MSIIQDLIKDLATHPHYKWSKGHLFRKGKLMVGKDTTLQNHLIATYHNIALRGAL
jgi:hypothetical protein